MESFEFQWKKIQWKRFMAVILAFVMTVMTMSDVVLAAGLSSETSEVDSLTPDVLTPDATPAITPAITPDEPDNYLSPDEVHFGVCALSSTSLSKSVGESATLKVYAYSTVGDITYTWYRDDEKLDCVSDTFTVTALASTDFTKYYCKVTSGTYSKTIRFSISQKNQIYATYITDKRVEAYYGSTVDFELEAASYNAQSTGLTYQWSIKKGADYVDLTGETSTKLETVYEGASRYRCKISDGVETITRIFYTTELDTTVIVDYDASNTSAEAVVGDTTTLHAVATSGNPYVNLNYQWYRCDSDP